MDRIEFSKKIRSELFNNAAPAENQTDPEFYDVMNRFLFGEVWRHGDLDAKTRAMITIVPALLHIKNCAGLHDN
jgi:4-carboxymuconolactone decarboxylase